MKNEDELVDQKTSFFELKTFLRRLMKREEVGQPNLDLLQVSILQNFHSAAMTAAQNKLEYFIS